MSIRQVDGELKTVRGTTNGNARGSAADRRRRREWLVETYAANVNAIRVVIPLDRQPLELDASVYDGDRLAQILGAEVTTVPACRCYRCGTLLTVETVTVDRIIPGCKGGTYRRNNIRPACGRCNSETGGKLTGTGVSAARAKVTR